MIGYCTLQCYNFAASEGVCFMALLNRILECTIMFILDLLYLHVHMFKMYMLVQQVSDELW
jgi:hypothetical protein